MSARTRPASALAVHGLLVLAVLVAVLPVGIVVMSSFKTQAALFDSPFTLPTGDRFSLDGYRTVFAVGQFGTYYANSLIVTVVSVIATVALSSLAAFGLAEYWSGRLGPFVLGLFAVGVMLPIRLGTVALLKMMVALDLVNTLTALVVVYTASALPLAVVLMTTYVRSIPRELFEAARIDGAGELRVFRTVMPLARPGMAAVAATSMLPIWNDLWFPLILSPGEDTQTVTLGVQQFVGQFGSNWPTLLAALTMGAVPLIVLFTLFSRQFIAGLSQGIGK